MQIFYTEVHSLYNWQELPLIQEVICAGPTLQIKKEAPQNKGIAGLILIDDSFLVPK